MTNIVTKTEILALVSLLFSTNYIRYLPIFGDILTENHLLVLFLQSISLSASTHVVKHFLGSKQSNVSMSMFNGFCMIIRAQKMVDFEQIEPLLDKQVSLAPTHVSLSVRNTFEFPFYQRL